MTSTPHPECARPTVVVRPMRPDEADRVGAITLASYDHAGRIDGPYRGYLADPRRRLDGSTAVLVAEVDGRIDEVDGQIVGTATFVLPHDREWEGAAEPQGDAAFRVLAVDPAAQGLGAGRQLVQACLDLAIRLGRSRMIIVSMSWMTRAHGLYGAMGFVRREDLDLRFPGGTGFAFTRDLRSDAADRFPPPGPVPDVVPWFEDVWGR